jgi:two-component system LytT family response regulator
MAIRCLAIDDEPLALKQIGSYISKTPFLELSAACRSALDALEYLSKKPVDILFVDINMPDLSGMDFVKSLSDRPLVIFTTAYSDYAVEGFRVDATDYLLKPFGYNDFLAAVNKAKARIDLKAARPAPEHPDNDHIFVKSDYKLVRINLADIDYIESMHEYVRIHLSSGKAVMTLLSLKAIEEQLPAPGFLRVHRSYIVNSSKIKIIERNRIVFDKVHIPVSDQYKQAFQDFLNRNSID